MMNIMHLNQWLSDREVKAICWTLIHSLWQGVLIAALAGMIISATRKTSAQLRYHLFCALLVTFLLAMGCTFIYELGWGASAVSGNPVVTITSDGTITQTTPTGSNGLSLLYAITGFLNDQAAGIFAVWLVCFLYKSFKLLGGIFYIHRIRTKKTVQAPIELKAKVSDLARNIGISKQVGILQSGLVKVPVTLGYLKPLIILPVGIILQLNAEQVETILWHELAHIRRRDYLVNILQSIVEAVLFFNPAILWLSALIREEREACCDDIVLANVDQKGSYLEALMVFQGQYATGGGLTMALSMRPNQLMSRLRRMVYQENKKLSILEMAVLLCGLILFSAFTFIPQAKPVLRNSLTFIKNTISHNIAETPPQKPVERKRKYIPIKIRQIADTAMVKSNPAMAGTDTAIKFKSVLFNKTNSDRANCEINVIDGQNNHYHMVMAEGLLTVVQFNGKVIAKADFSQYEGLIKQIDAMLDSKKRMIVTHTELRPHAPKKHRADSVLTKAYPSAKKVRKPIVVPDSIASIATNPSPKKHPRHIDISADRARVRGVIQELVDAKIVANAAEVGSFGLTDTELFVNGKKQSDVLQRKLKKTYGIKTQYGLYYGPVQMKATGVIFGKEDL
jgi:bla regulator protein BlaR1